MKKYAFLVVMLSALAISAPKADAAKVAPQAQAETTLDVKAKLDSAAKMYVNRANETLKPNRRSVAVTKEKGQYVARFLEVDSDTLTTEIYPGKGPGCQYVGHVVYLEKVYECVGSSKASAQSGDFKQTRARRVRELTRYDGQKWIF